MWQTIFLLIFSQKKFLKNDFNARLHIKKIALALHCWHCDSKFKDCRDPFNTENLNKEKSQGLYAECPPANSGGTPICLKIISQRKYL